MATSKFANVGKRAASGAVLVLFTVSCIWFSPYSLLLAFGIFMTGALFEFYKLIGLKDSPQYALGILTGVALYAFSGLALLQFVAFKYALYVILPILFSLISATFSGAKNPFSDFSKMLGGLVYACFPFIAILFVGINAQNASYDSFPILLFMVLVWCTDTFAYLSGKFFGKNLMAKSISPGKTWEGTVGGVLGSLLVAVGVSQFTDSHSIVDILVVWFAGSVLAVLGDLSESKLKRSVHVKDSGKFMPGHGGFLDRFDSLLLSAPFLMVYFLLVKA